MHLWCTRNFSVSSTIHAGGLISVRDFRKWKATLPHPHFWCVVFLITSPQAGFSFFTEICLFSGFTGQSTWHWLKLQRVWKYIHHVSQTNPLWLGTVWSNLCWGHIEQIIDFFHFTSSSSNSTETRALRNRPPILYSHRFLIPSFSHSSIPRFHCLNLVADTQGRPSTWTIAFRLYPSVDTNPSSCVPLSAGCRGQQTDADAPPEKAEETLWYQSQRTIWSFFPLFWVFDSNRTCQLDKWSKPKTTRAQMQP